MTLYEYQARVDAAFAAAQTMDPVEVFRQNAVANEICPDCGYRTFGRREGGPCPNCEGLITK